MAWKGTVVVVEDLMLAVGELADLSTREFDVDDMLRRLCEVAVHSLPVDGVGVMKTGEDNSTLFVHASDPPVAGLEQLQETLQQGPCRDAIDSGQMVTAATIAQMSWPAFAEVAADIGIQAVLAVPMVSRGRTFGVLDLYWRDPHTADTQDRAAAQLLADVAVSYLTMAQDRAASRLSRDQLAHRVLHDQLTGLPNRGLMQELIDHALAASTRSGALVAVLFVDLDHFKAINDTYGHQSGDEVLQIIAHRMQAAVRPADTVGRISGDEFIILCQDVTDDRRGLDALTALGHRIGQHIAPPIALLQHLPSTTGSITVKVTASIGIGVTTAQLAGPAHPAAAALIHTADLAMYQAKSAGRDRVIIIRHP